MAIEKRLSVSHQSCILLYIYYFLWRSYLPCVSIIGVSVGELHHWHRVVYDVVTANQTIGKLNSARLGLLLLGHFVEWNLLRLRRIRICGRDSGVLDIVDWEVPDASLSFDWLDYVPKEGDISPGVCLQLDIDHLIKIAGNCPFNFRPCLM